MKATEQYFFCGTVYYAVQGGFNFWVCGWNPSVTIQMKATEQYFPMVQFIILNKVVPKCFNLCMKSLINSVSVVVNFLSQVILASLFLGMVMKLK